MENPMSKADADSISTEEDVPPPSDIIDRWNELDICIDSATCLVEVARDAIEESGNDIAPRKMAQVISLLYVAIEQTRAAAEKSSSLFAQVRVS
jgi:hypothetical protein